MNDEVRAWLAKAENDYNSAAFLVATPAHANPDLVTYLCQQCVEKWLKAALVARRVDPPHIHNLFELSAQLTALEPGWSWDARDLRWLTLCGTVYRYPLKDASAQDARRALDLATRIRSAMQPLLE